MRLSDQLPIQIISVDSAMIYRGMDIGTAKPDAQTLDQYPHQLVDICDPTERYSTADFRRDALVAIEESFNAGKIPLLVGGTFLYFQSLLEGISPIPSVSQSILDDLAEKLELEGSPALHQILSEVDPESGVRLNPNDSQRVVRALSVYYETGKPLTYFWSLPKQAGLPYPFIKLALANHDEKKRNQQIALRYQAMIERGLVAEVERLRQMYPELDLDYPSMRAVGYRQIWNYLEGETSLEDAVKLAIIATRQYAKRQRTWLRREVDLLTYDVGKPNFLSDLSQNVMQFLR